MGTPVKNTVTSQQKYVSVTMRDSRNGVKKEYSFPEGTVFNTTNHSYKLTQGGIIKSELYSEEGNSFRLTKNPQKVNGNTIDITLPQMIALGVLDTDKNRKIDNYDAKNLPLYMEGVPGDGYNGEGDIIAAEINNRLERSNSDFIVFDQSNCSSGVNISRDGSFSVSFVKDEKSHTEDNCKELEIHLPEYLEKEAQRKAELEEYNKELDKRYAEKHYIRNFLGITRSEFEKNNQRDY